MTQAELQERIDALIIGIQDAEAAGAITAEIVGEVLDFLNDSSKSMTANVADTRQKLTDVQSAVNRLLGHNATEAIENFNEVVNFLAGLKDTDTLAAKLADITGQLATKADQADFDKVAHLKNTPAIYRLWEAHNDNTVSLNYNARKKADADGRIIDAGGVTLPSATPYTNTPDGPTGGNAGVMTAQQATELQTVVSDMEKANDELETHKLRLDALTPVVLTQKEYDALAAAGAVKKRQHYAIIEETEA